MYKLKYYSLENSEKEKLKQDFYQTEYGKNIKMRLDRLFVIGILGIIFSIILLIINKNIWDLVTSITLFLASIFFIIASFKVRIKKLNDYLIKNRKKNNK